MSSTSFGDINSNTGIQLGVNNAPIYFSTDREDPLVKLDNGVLSSLAFPQMLSRRDNIESCHPNTCEWILDLEEYQSWKSKPRGLLWIKGKPGSGKSTVMAFLHRRLEDSLVGEDSEGIRLDFFFSARGAELQRTPLGMFRSLLNQLFLQDIAVRPRIREIYEKRCRKYGSGVHDWEWTRVLLEELLTNAILKSASHQRVVVFVDALDETGAESAEKLAIYFHRLLGRAAEKNLHVQICISCRHYPIISTAGAVEIRVEDHNCDDISRYVKDLLVEMAGDSQSQATTDELAGQLTDQAKGVFQWVHLILPLIKRKIVEGESMEEIYAWSRNVPEDLREVYAYVLNNVIDSGNREQSLLLFQWVYLAEQPLTITELRYAFATSVAKMAPFPRRWEKVKDFVETDERMRPKVLALSGGLVETVPSEHNSETVQVVHQSVNEFLRSGGLKLLQDLSDTSEPYGSGEEVFLRGQAVLYRSCLVYFVMSSTPQGFPRDMKGVDDVKVAIQKVFDGQPLLAYAARYLFIHAEKAGRCRVGTLQDEQNILQRVADRWEVINNAVPDKYSMMNTQKFLTQSNQLRLIHIAAAANLVDVLERIPLDEQVLIGRDGLGNTALHLAAQFGQKEAAKWLLEHGFDRSAENNKGSTLFIQAAGFGQVAFVEWLLHDSAHLGGPKMEWQGALYAACKHGQSSVVEILLAAGADPNIQCGRLGNPLQAAANAGNRQVETCEILLAAGADPNLQGGFYGTALQAAGFCGHTEVLRMLLDAGADPNSQGGCYGTPLQAAASSRGGNAIQILLDAGADPNLQGGFFGTALQAAASNGNRKGIQILLDAGADPNLQGGRYGTALQAAAANGSKQTVRALLTAGANPNAQGGEYGTALQAAASKGSTEIVEILLADGADPNVQCGYFGTALQAAAYYGRIQPLQMLLAAGAHSNLQGGTYGNALQAAARSTSEESVKMVQIILAAEADPNFQSGHFGTAPQTAGYYGRIELLQILLSAGADPNLQGGTYGNALQAAASGGSMKAVEILLAAGADPNSQGGYFGTALQAAGFCGHTEVLRMLLSTNTYVDTQSGRYGSALFAAIHGKRSDIVRVLLDAGADPSLPDQLGRTPLHVAALTGGLDIVCLFPQFLSAINTRDGLLRTPLHLALCFGHLWLTRKLLQEGADPSIQDSHGRNALDWALGDEDIVLEIRKSCPEIVATTEETQKFILHQAIFQISSTILDGKLKDPWPRAQQIGRLLLSLKKEKDARYIFKLGCDCAFKFIDLQDYNPLLAWQDDAASADAIQACGICKKRIVGRLYLCRECAFIYACTHCAQGISYTIGERPPHRREHKVFELFNTDDLDFSQGDIFHEKQIEKLKTFLKSLITEYPGPAPGHVEAESSNDCMSNQALEKTTEFPRAAIGRVKLACATLSVIFVILLRYFLL